MTDPTDIELNSMCNEWYIPKDLLPDYEFDDDDGLDACRGIYHALRLTVGALVLIFAVAYLAGCL